MTAQSSDLMSSNNLEVWLRGPLENLPVLVQPVAQALLQAKEEISGMMQDFPEELLWEKVEGMASPGFHLQHLTGVLSRLFTYARGEQLTQEQLDFLENEGQPGLSCSGLKMLLQRFDEQAAVSVAELATVDVSVLTEKREVGRNRLPSTVMGLYIHAAEHTMRHVGQLLVTVKFLMANANASKGAG